LSKALEAFQARRKQCNSNIVLLAMFTCIGAELQR